MITYLSNKPILSILFSLFGIGLLVAAFVINPFKPFKAVAQNGNPNASCADGSIYDIPDATRSNTYASEWNVTQWLRYDGTANNNKSVGAFPIGPAAWLVCGRNRDANGKVVQYHENWTLAQVRIASSRKARDTRGKAFYRNTGFGGHLEVRNSVLGAEGDDTAFKEEDNIDWDPVGLYGILRDSKDNLSQSHSYFPSRWIVTGTYLDE